jgi:plasmid stabilization system protein ParE
LHDLIEIGEYIAKDNAVAVERMIERLEEGCRLLAVNPDLGFVHDELPRELLVWPVGSCLIIYRVESAGISIAAFAHGARDLGSLFPDSR